MSNARLLHQADEIAATQCMASAYVRSVIRDIATRVRELEAERSAMIDNVRFARERAKRAEAERDALRAEVERLRGLLEEAALGWEPGAEICQRIDAALAKEKP